MLLHHPNRTLADLARKLVRLVHGSILSRVGASTIPGAVQIGSNGDYNLSGERYREGAARSSHYATVPIGDICELFNGRAFKPEDWQAADSSGIPIVRIQNLNNPDSSFNYYTGEVSERNAINNGELLFSWSGSRGTSFGAHIWKGHKAVLNQHIFKVGFDESRATKMYLLHALNKAVIEVEENLHGGVGLVHITKGNLERIRIPLPPLEVQKEIVAEIEGYQKVIDGARAVLDNYRPHIPIHPDWPMVELTSVVWFQEGPGILSKDFHKEGIPLVRLAGLSGSTVTLHGCNCLDPEMVAQKWNHFRLRVGDILVSTSASFGRPAIVTPTAEGAVFYTGLIRFRPLDESLDDKYLETFLGSPTFLQQGEALATGSSIRHFGPMHLKQMQIPLPPLAIQQAIVAEIEAEQALVNANRDLIARMGKKIQSTLARVWGENPEGGQE